MLKTNWQTGTRNEMWIGLQLYTKHNLSTVKWKIETIQNDLFSISMLPLYLDFMNNAVICAVTCQTRAHPNGGYF
ncbi:hypothetical protein HZU73_05193 [Apis mellifera caucasica]|nr:hypothetical protein HZU73_05193 [Apis mellifera caucasica]KAG9434356.1 hypothetical protein HZU67_03596 [Apis mellifera carnica]